MKTIFTLLLVLLSLLSFSQSNTIVISQVYGAGGNSGALLNADYVELHNVSGVSQSLSGLSIQYGSPTVTGAWSGVFVLPSVSIPAGAYYLIQMSGAGATGAALPTPDVIANPAILMGGSNGRVALAIGTTALNACPAASAYIDFVGYGTSTCFEGTAPTAAISSTLAAFRNNNGCTDTDNNGSDFSVLTPAPRNSATTAVNCVSIPPSLTVTGTIADFGNIFIGSSSPSQSYNLSGANLTGAPGTITVTAPSSDFQVSNNNTTWGATATIAYTSASLSATPVWIRFTPQTAGLKTGNVTNTGGGVTTAVNVAVSGTGDVPPTPVLSAGSLTAFGNVCINTTAGPNSFTINGNNLTAAAITVGPLAGFSFSTTAAGIYIPSLTLTQPGGLYTQQVYVQFTPLANQSYDGNITIMGGGATAINVAASGSGNNNAPSIVTGAASSITINSAVLAGSISAAGCTAVTAYGVEYSLLSGFVNGTVVPGSNISGGSFTVPVSGLTPATTYFYKAYATNAGGTAYGAQQSFTTASPVLTATPLTAFGAVCINTTSAANSFTLSSTGLGTANVTIGPRTGYSFATTANGTFTPALTIVQPGGPFSQQVFVKFSPTAIQSYSGNIPVSGGGANTLNIPVSGLGVNSVAVVTTGSAAQVTANSAMLSGSIIGPGCSNVTTYGIEYSGISGFANGQGARIQSSNLAGTGFSAIANGLVQNTTYFFKAYATNDGGTAYGDEQSFTTLAIPSGLVIYATPVTRGGTLRFSMPAVRPAHYTVQVINSNGQLVHIKELIVQVNFIDELMTLPGHIGPGVYTLRIINPDFSIQQSFMIR